MPQISDASLRRSAKRDNLEKILSVEHADIMGFLAVSWRDKPSFGVMEHARDERGLWKPGIASPNPAGRPKGIARQFRELIEEKDGIGVIGRMIAGDIPCAPNTRLEAVKFAIERGWGKAVDVQVVIDGTAPGGLELTDDVLETLAQHLQKALPKRSKAPDPALVEGEIVSNHAEPLP